MNELLLAWLRIRRSSIAVQTIPTIHHFVFFATSNTVVLRINQCVATINTTTTDTFIMSMVGSTGAPLLTLVNMDVSNRHAVPKSGDLKNTQVTFTRKKVNRAIKKFCAVFVRKNAGANEAEVVTTCTVSTAGINSGTGETSVGSLLARNNRSMHK